VTASDPVAIVDRVAAVFADHPDPDVRAVAHWLQGYPTELLAHLGLSNGTGYSARQAAALAKRDFLLRGLKLPAGRLSSDLSGYRGNGWIRDRLAEVCPYGSGDRKATFWAILRLSDRDLSARQVRRILRGGHQPGF
jgi:hypothetical protein